jgi:hypothetical protein
MIYNIQYNAINDRSDILNYLKSIKTNNEKFTMLDVGSYGNPWAIKYITATLDVNQCNHGIYHFTGNMNLPEVWESVLEHVKLHGKFDFCNCTHTLEDISNPQLVCNMISKVATSGFIAIPSKFSELKRRHNFEGPIRGWIHHRWIFNIENSEFIGYPKLPFVEYLDTLNDIESQHKEEIGELSFYWKDSINLKLINGDFFPSAQYMFEIYKNLKNN